MQSRSQQYNKRGNHLQCFITEKKKDYKYSAWNGRDIEYKNNAPLAKKHV